MNRAPGNACIARIASLLLAAALCACAPSAEGDKGSAGAGDPAARPAAAAVSSAAPQVGIHDAELVTAVGLSKVSVPLQVRFRLDSRPVVGQPVKVELVVTPLQLAQIRGLQFHVQASDGLALQGESELSMGAAAPGIPIRREIVVVPQTVGILKLEVVGSVDTNSESLSQTYSIPLIVSQQATAR